MTGDKRIPRRFGREGGHAGGDFVAVLFRRFIRRFASRDVQPLGLHFARKTHHVVARAIHCAVEFSAANKHAAFQTEVTDQRVQHHHRPRIIETISCHHAAVGDDRRFTTVTGKGVCQRDDVVLSHAALLAVLRKRHFFRRFFQTLEAAFHRHATPVGERHLACGKQRGAQAITGGNQLVVLIHHQWVTGRGRIQMAAR